MKSHLQNWILMICFLLTPASTLMAAEDMMKIARPGVVEVRSFEDNRLLGRSLGFVLDDKGHILTSLGEMDRADKISVITHTGVELVAGKVLDNRDARVAVVKVSPSPDLAPLAFAKQASAAGRRVYSLDLASDDVYSLKLAQGTVSQMLVNKKAGDAGYIQHNALSSSSGYGAPLLNNCGEILGMNTTKPAFLVGVFENYDPGKQGANYALGAEWITAFLDAKGLSVKHSAEICLSEEQKARAAISKVEEKARAEISEAKKKLTDVEKKAQEAQVKAQEAQEKAIAAQKAREQASKNLESMKKNLDQMKQKSVQEQEKMKQEIAAAENRLKQLKQQQLDLEASAEKQRQKAELARKLAKEREDRILIISVAVAVALLVLVVFFVVRKKKAVRQVEQQKSAAVEAMQQVQSELEEKKAQEEHLKNLPDVLLEGTTPEGDKLAIKITGASTGRRDGAVIGRNPSMCDYVVNHPEISRKHFRLLNVSGQLMIEDLGSTNGTKVNGEPLVPNQLEAVMNNSVLSMGELQLTVRTVL